MDPLITQQKKSWHETNIRWITLALACAMQMGNYFCYDFPSVLQNQIEKQFDVSAFDYDLLYTVYSLPNIILPLFGGILIDYIGIRKGIVGFSLFLILGQSLCILGSIQNKFYLLLIGRIIYGLGGENMSVVQSSIVSKWFQGKEMAFALGFLLCLSLGSVLNNQITPKVYQIDQNITLSLIVGLIFLFISWLVCIVLALIDKKSDDRDNEQIIEEQEKITFKDIKEFKVDLLLVVISCMVSYTNLFVFQQNNIKMFETLYKLTEGNANFLNPIPYLMGAVLTPFMGMTVDKIGRRPLFLIISGVIIIMSNLLFLLSPSCESQCLLTPIIGQAILGVFYVSYAAVLWPMVPLCVPAHTVGTAFGITNAVQNLGLTIGPLVVGKITDSKDVTNRQYRLMMVFFSALGVFALINNVLLKIYDSVRLNNKLSQAFNQKKQVEPSFISESISMPQYENID